MSEGEETQPTVVPELIPIRMLMLLTDEGAVVYTEDGVPVMAAAEGDRLYEVLTDG